MTTGEYHDVRASEQDRRLVLDHLNDAFAAGLLSREDFRERAANLAKALTRDYISGLVADLPLEYRTVTFRPDHDMRAELEQLRRQVAQHQGTNGMAIAALVCGVGQFAIPFAGIAAIILGHKARRQIRRTGEQGEGMARAGAALGWIGIALTAVALLFALLVSTSAGAPN
jgi:hypothetical protein